MNESELHIDVLAIVAVAVINRGNVVDASVRRASFKDINILQLRSGMHRKM